MSRCRAWCRTYYKFNQSDYNRGSSGALQNSTNLKHFGSCSLDVFMILKLNTILKILTTSGQVLNTVLPITIVDLTNGLLSRSGQQLNKDMKVVDVKVLSLIN